MPRTVAANHPPHFLSYFSRIDDPRQSAKVLFPFEELFLLVLCAVISGSDGWRSIALYV
ncbi:MAG: transposase family protein [Rhodobacteraceae bacterium]|nr:transposase family protein [Paracoccaceae bacterium]